MGVLENTVLRLVVSYLFPDEVLMQNIVHLLLDSAGGSDDEGDVVDDMEDYVEDFMEHWAAVVSDDIAAGDIKVYKWDTVGEDWDEVGTGINTMDGVVNEIRMPHGVALVQNFQTTDPDVQGRKYWGGLCEVNHEDGLWTASALSQAILTAADLVAPFVGAATGASFVPGVWSPTNVAFYAYQGAIFTNVVVGYQRRRKPGVGV